MTDQSTWSFETKQIHAGQAPDPTTGARNLPIYQTTSYVFKDTEHAANLFGLKELGNIYTRIMNPTQDAVEQKIAALEGGIAALMTASGMSATTLALMNLAEAGDHIVASAALYGGTVNLLQHTLPKYGIEVTLVEDPHDIEQWKAAVKPNTKAFFGETIGNPKDVVLDIAAIADAAHAAGVPLVVDNTIATPYVLRPIEHGADIVVHALTKYMGGHGNSIAGAIVDSGKFPWAEHKDRFPMLNEPDPSYHGVVYTEAFGPAAFIGRSRVVPLRNTGAALSPFNAFLILQGIETLPLRMERHTENAIRVAEFLQRHDQVSWVKYAGLPDHPEHDLAQKYMGGKPASILSFGIKGGLEAGARFIDALNLILRLVNIGDAKSLACHPASTTHRQLGPEELEKAGVGQDMIRLSIGLEHIDDLLDDLGQALEASKG
jgi:O-acetylhomoserine (thiol)-lyase